MDRKGQGERISVSREAKILMKVQFEPEDIQSIAQAVTEMIRPLLSANGRDKAEDVLLTPDETARLLSVKKPQIYAWVNESKFSDNGIPFLKAGKFLRFSKKDVLKWMQKHKKTVEDW
jgi:excisionase family DNA binding protein